MFEKKYQSQNTRYQKIMSERTDKILSDFKKKKITKEAANESIVKMAKHFLSFEYYSNSGFLFDILQKRVEEETKFLQDSIHESQEINYALKKKLEKLEKDKLILHKKLTNITNKFLFEETDFSHHLIVETGWPKPIKSTLIENGYIMIKDLFEVSDSELLKIPSFGRKSLSLLKKKLRERELNKGD